MSFLSYLVVPSKLKDPCPTSTTFDSGCAVCLRQKTVYDYITWILTDAEAASVLKSNHMATIPAYVVARIKNEILPNIRCAGADGNYTRASAWPAGTQAVSMVGGGDSVQAPAQVAFANTTYMRVRTHANYPSQNQSLKQANNAQINRSNKRLMLESSAQTSE
jgi:hypothetical protein